ncbi:MAG: hypothetical protein ACRD6X_10840 [Pyrinomonadaceae bacterium]
MKAAPEKAQNLQWIRRMDPPYYVNSAAISANGDRVIAGTFFFAYSPTAEYNTPAQPDQFGTFCFDRDGNQLWADKFQGSEGVYAVAISPSGSVAAAGGKIQPVTGFLRAYDANNGTQLANYTTGTRVNQIALSLDGSVLVAAADKVYLAERKNGVFPQNPSVYSVPATPGNNVQSISMPKDGSWFVVGDYAGTVYMIENNSGSMGMVYQSATGLLGTVHCVAAAALGDWFIAVGGSQEVYLFSTESIQQGQFVSKFTLPATGRVGWAAISFTGEMITVVQNIGGSGVVYALQNKNGALSQLWSQKTLANPNSTSLDASGQHVTVADGYPDGTPGHFYLFNGTNGDPVWNYETSNMNWPMFIDAFGDGIIAGSDQGNVYYFTPE